MPKPIVVGLDDSEPSRVALDWALNRARALGLPIVLVHSVPQYWATPETGYTDTMQLAARELLAAEAARAAQITPTVTVSTSVHQGEAAKVLSDLSTDASLVVIGTDKTGSTRGEGFGVLSLQIATLSLSPVAVVPLLPMTGRSGIVVGIDGSAEAAAAIDLAADEASRLEQELHTVYAGRIPAPWLRRNIPQAIVSEAVEQEGRTLLAGAAARVRASHPELTVHQHLQAAEFPAEALVLAAANARLLVVGGKGRGALKNVLIGSVGQDVLMHIPCPTIIARVPQREQPRG
ncbi:universal stress protein [Arthrobacter sp. A5]|uniref:universal stress protein n=1 Tax=Arthrobacter sp. A5 TaxID=576926 RepID=UPI003DA7C9AB